MNIVVLCTYPIKNPKHGGQLRVRNIVDAYRATGHHVEVVGVQGSEQYENEEGFVPCPKEIELAACIPNPFLMEDYAIGRLFFQNDRNYECLAAKIKCKPDLIHIEQPWLFSFAQRYVTSRHLDARLVYGSQNIEWHLKHSILSSYTNTAIARQYVELIKKVELEAIAGADAIVCVSENDLSWVKSQTDKPVVLAPNGVKPWQMTSLVCDEAKLITNGHRYALYCASAHPPNMIGFFEMFGGGFGSLKPDEKLVVAGGAGWAIAGDRQVHQSAKLAEKLVVAGVVSQPCLEGLLDGAQCVVLPLTQGGGTNLKTAEALWSGKHIVATSVAMRGFERFIGSTGVNVTDEPRAFKQILRRAMSAEPLRLSEEDRDARRSVLWESCLNPLVSLVSSLNS